MSEHPEQRIAMLRSQEEQALHALQSAQGEATQIRATIMRIVTETHDETTRKRFLDEQHALLKRAYEEVDRRTEAWEAALARYLDSF